MNSNTDALTTPEFIRPGQRVEWLTWTGEYASATIQIVSDFRVSTDKAGIYWEATCFKSLAESLAACRGLRAAAVDSFPGLPESDRVR